MAGSSREQYFAVRLDVMRDLVAELSENKAIKKILGEPVEEKIMFVAVGNDINIISAPDVDLDEMRKKQLAELFKLSFLKIQDFKKG
ncbi:MAG TPA: hypothetical protein ENN13_03445 [Candidatus Altiarchaeales archaeon]|nr:hypothetical protein [Candidatus Altiarchaeales archaeon]